MEIRVHLFFVFQMLLICVSSVTSAKIELYANGNYSNLILEVSPTAACYNVPRNKVQYVYSAATDTCFITYTSPDCKAPYSRKYIPGKTSTPNNGFRTDSLQTCNDQEGGLRLHIDITKHFPSSHPPIIPDVLESYSDICGCVNVPNYVQILDAWSIHNHANGLLAYFEPNCGEHYSKALHIEAGHNANSRDMHTHSRSYSGTTLKIQSIGPDQKAEYFKAPCIKNCATVSSIGSNNTIKINADSICDFKTKTESVQIGWLLMERMETLISELQNLSKKVDELGRMNRESALDLENTKHGFNDKQEKQRDEIQELTDKINLYIHE